LVLDEDNPVNRTRSALAAGNKATALNLWQDALERYPAFARSAPDAVEIEMGLGRFDEAEALIAEKRQTAPRDPQFAGWYGLLGQRRGDVDEAIRRWAEVRKAFPRYWMGYVFGSRCLRQGGKLVEAEALAKRAIQLFPNEAQAWFEWAQLAEQRSDWSQALARWNAVREKYQHIQGDLGSARALAELGQFDEAERRLQEVQRRRPLLDEIAIALARLATQRGADPEEVIARWADVRRRCPQALVGYQEGYRQLAAIGRDTEAEELLVTAIEKIPAEPWPAVEYALRAHARKAWETAANRWAEVRTKWPQRRDAYYRAAEALAALGRREEAIELQAGPPTHNSNSPIA
jgi:tetratricopeptide (TPR) repeat protein